MDTFGTAITCMDGRIQSQVHDYLKATYGVKYVDTITLAGPVKVIADNEHERVVENIKYRSDISVNVHHSRVIAVVGHYDCAAITCCDDDHKGHVLKTLEKVKEWYPECEVIGIWLNEKFEISLL